MDPLNHVVFRTTYEMLYNLWNDAVEMLNLNECLKFKCIYDEFKAKFNQLTHTEKSLLMDLRESMMWLNEDIDRQLLSLGNDSGSEQSYSTSDSGNNGSFEWPSKRSPSE